MKIELWQITVGSFVHVVRDTSVDSFHRSSFRLGLPYTMEFSINQLNKLRNILVDDYGVVLEETQLKEFAERATRMTLISYKHMFRHIEKEANKQIVQHEEN